MSHSKNPFVRGYDGLSVQRLLAISYDDDCPLSYLPLHVSQSHLPDSQVERHACVFCDDFALITEGQNVPPELDAQCPSHGIARNLVYAVMAEEAGQPLHVGDTYSEEAAREVVAAGDEVERGTDAGRGLENFAGCRFALTKPFKQGIAAERDADGVERPVCVSLPHPTQNPLDFVAVARVVGAREAVRFA